MKSGGRQGQRKVTSLSGWLRDDYWLPRRIHCPRPRCRPTRKGGHGKNPNRYGHTLSADEMITISRPREWCGVAHKAPSSAWKSSPKYRLARFSSIDTRNNCNGARRGFMCSCHRSAPLPHEKRPPTRLPSPPLFSCSPLLQ